MQSSKWYPSKLTIRKSRCLANGAGILQRQPLLDAAYMVIMATVHHCTNFFLDLVSFLKFMCRKQSKHPQADTLQKQERKINR